MQEEGPTLNWEEVLPVELEGQLNLANCIGEGQFAQVFKAEWRRQEVAVKVIKSGSVNDETKFVQELNMIASLRSPYLVQLIGANTKELPYFLVTEYMDAGSLWKILKDQKDNDRIDIKMAFRFARDIVIGLLFLHTKNVIHRDLKPENILITYDRGARAKIADFGTARILSSTTKPTGETGTWSFMAPEVIKEEFYSLKADIYSLGLCLYELFIGINPLRGMNVVTLVHNVVNERYQPPFPKDCDEKLSLIIKRCIQYDADKRPTAEQVLDEIEGIEKSILNIPSPTEKATDISQSIKKCCQCGEQFKESENGLNSCHWHPGSWVCIPPEAEW